MSPAAIDLHHADLKAAARRYDERAFARLVEHHRAELKAHCYRMLGSAADAEDTLQETLVRAEQACPTSFEGPSSPRSWLFRIATNACLRMIERGPRRVLPVDHGPASDPHDPPQPALVEHVWLDPYPDAALSNDQTSLTPEEHHEQRESVELAFLAALQHLPARQRAALLLRDVLRFAPAEMAQVLDAPPVSVCSILLHARQAVAERLPARTQQATLRSIGDERLGELVERYARAWEEGDVATIAAMLTDDATLAMPPWPSWYRGRAAVTAFLAAVPLSRRWRWRHTRVGANGQLALGVYTAPMTGEDLTAHAIEVLSLDQDALITDITTFHTPEAFARFGLPNELWLA